LTNINRTKQENRIGHIMRGDSKKRDNGGKKEVEEGKMKTYMYLEAHGLDDGGRIQETQRKGTTTGGVESVDISTCGKADNIFGLRRNITQYTVVH